MQHREARTQRVARQPVRRRHMPSDLMQRLQTLRLGLALFGGSPLAVHPEAPVGGVAIRVLVGSEQVIARHWLSCCQQQQQKRLLLPVRLGDVQVEPLGCEVAVDC